MKGNMPIYHIDRRIAELDGKPFGDKSHIIYVNGAYSGNESTPLGRLIHDLFCTEPDTMYYKELAERVRYFKKDSKGVDTMCEIWDEVLNEGLEQGMKQGIKQGLEQGESKLARLINILLQNGKTQDVQAAVNDEARRKQLYLEYNIS